MKNLKTFFVLFFTFLAITFASAQNPHSYWGQSVNSKGEILDVHGKKIGKVDKSGKVKNVKGVVLGTIAKNGTVTDKSKNILGKAQPNGNFISNNGKLIVIMDDFGKAKDFHGHMLYKTNENFRQQSVAIHCFFGAKCCMP